jgi:hypothetical protein
MSDDDDGFSLKEEMAAFGDELLGKAYPTGEYDMVVAKSAAAKTGGGKHCIKVVLKFVGGKYKDKTVPDQLNWSPESDIAARIFAQGIAKMGATQEWIKANSPSMAQVAAKLQGAKVHVKLTEDDWNGMPRNRVAYMSTISLGAGGNGGVSMAKGEAEDLGAEAEDLGVDLAADDEPPVTVPDSDDAVNLGGDDDWP